MLILSLVAFLVISETLKDQLEAFLKVSTKGNIHKENEGLTLETPASETLYECKFT